MKSFLLVMIVTAIVAAGQANAQCTTCKGGNCRATWQELANPMAQIAPARPLVGPLTAPKAVGGVSGQAVETKAASVVTRRVYMAGPVAKTMRGASRWFSRPWRLFGRVRLFRWWRSR